MEQGRTILKQARKDMIEKGLIEQNTTDSIQNTPKTPVKKQKSHLNSSTKVSKLFDKTEERSEPHQV